MSDNEDNADRAREFVAQLRAQQAILEVQMADALQRFNAGMDRLLISLHPDLRELDETFPEGSYRRGDTQWK